MKENAAIEDAVKELSKAVHTVAKAHNKRNNNVSTSNSKLTLIAISKLVPFKNHPFQQYDGERLDELASSIKAIGLQNPIIVRPVSGGLYEILSGHNRVNAIITLGHVKVFAIIKHNLTDEAAERIVVESNLNQQSFSDWKFSQQIKVIKIYSKYIHANSLQGKRTDLLENATSAHSEQKSDGHPKRMTSRDKISKQLGISSSVFQRYKSIADLDESMLNAICELLDEKRIGFMSAYRLSMLKGNVLNIALGIINHTPGAQITGSRVKALYDESKVSDTDLTEEVIKRMLLTK